MEVKEQGFPSFEIFSNQGVGGCRHQCQGYAPRSLRRRPVETEEDARRRRAGDSHRRGGGEAPRSESCGPRGHRARRAERHRFPRRDRQDRRPAEGARARTFRAKACSATCLPIVEGTTVNTKYGMVKTDHILFIAAGAFHVSKPSDLIPEMQGRFPIRVELESLTQDDFVRILQEPKNALTMQYRELLATGGRLSDFHRRSRA